MTVTRSLISATRLASGPLGARFLDQLECKLYGLDRVLAPTVGSAFVGPFLGCRRTADQDLDRGLEVGGGADDQVLALEALESTGGKYVAVGFVAIKLLGSRRGMVEGPRRQVTDGPKLSPKKRSCRG